MLLVCATKIDIELRLFDSNTILVKNAPHAPGRLFVGVAPRKHVGEGSDVRSETKIFNLDSYEFGSNLPLKKNVPPFPFRSPKTAGTEVF